MTTAFATGDLLLRSDRLAGCVRTSADRLDSERWWEPTQLSERGTRPATRDAIRIFADGLDWVASDVLVARHHVVEWRESDSEIGAPRSLIFLSAEAAQPGDVADVLAALERAQAVLGVSQRDLLQASGISRRTYYSWKRKPASARPRLASAGRLWRLLDAIDDLQALLGERIDLWLKVPERGSLLAHGRFDELVDEAVASTAGRRIPAEPDVPGVAEVFDIQLPVGVKLAAQDSEDDDRP